MNYKIEKNTVQETLIIPLYARKMCTELYPNLYRDETAVRLFGEIDYDFSALEKKSRSLMQRFGFLEVAMRQNDLAFEVRDYLRAHPNAAVVNLGCGLDATGRSCGNGSCKLYNLDFPDVIRVRDELLPAGPREENIPCDLNDTAWFDRIRSPPAGRTATAATGGKPDESFSFDRNIGKARCAADPEAADDRAACVPAASCGGSDPWLRHGAGIADGNSADALCLHRHVRRRHGGAGLCAEISR